jgi:two-component system sensor histidine kinase YesM
MLKLNFFYKQLLSFILIGVIPLIIIGSISYLFLTKVLQDSLSKQTLNNVLKIGEGVDLLISELGEIVVYLLCEDVQVRKALLSDPEANIDYINQRVKALAGKRDVRIFISDTTGMVTFSTCEVPEIYDISVNQGQGIFNATDAVKNGFIIYPNNHRHDLGETVIFSLARAIRDLKDRPIGYVIVELEKEHLFNINYRLNTLYNMNFLVLDPEYCILSNLYNPQAEKTILETALLEKFKNQKSGVFLTRINNRQFFIAHKLSQYSGLTTVGIVPIDYVVENTNFIKDVTILSCLLCLAICLVLAFFMARSVSQPINELVYCMRQVEGGDLKTRVEFSSTDEIGLLGRNFNKMVARLNFLVNSITEKQERLKHAEIKALQAQINPHFLYNTLDTIKWLAKLNMVDELQTIVTELGKLLRSTISSNKEIITVEESIKTIESYINIQKIRYRNRLQVSINISPDIYDYHVPKLLLQPIVENAIIHGLENKVGKGNLVINGYQEADELIFEIIDDGIGIEANKLALINAKKDLASTTDSIGLQNVNRRIQLYYGASYGLHIKSQAQSGTIVTLRLPLLKREVDNAHA